MYLRKIHLKQFQGVPPLSGGQIGGRNINDDDLIYYTYNHIYITNINCILGTNWVQVPMSKNIEKECLSKNGGKNYYIQFHIKPWMRQLRQLDKYKDRKNFKQSLRTPSLAKAIGLLNIKLEESEWTK